MAEQESDRPKEAAGAGRGGASLGAWAGFLGLLLSLVAAGLVIVFWERPPVAPRDASEREAVPKRLPRPAPPSEDFTGSAVCAECHAQIAQRYAGHPMSISLTRLDASPLVEDYENNVRFAPTPRREYWVERRDGQVVHHDLLKGPQGETLAEQSAPVTFAIGSGQRGRSYLVRRDAYLFMSPLSWYSAKGCWDLSPQYPVEGHLGFERPASERCLLCHAGRMNYAEPATSELALRYAEEPFAESAIGCERCHGPGRAHVEFRRARGTERAQPDAGAVDPIVNPAKLDIERRDAVCNQCHLQGDVIVLRYGRLHGDFRPGDRLGDIWTIFVSDTGIDGKDATRAVSQVEQVRVSRCFQESGAKLSCTSCHDPHETPPEASKGAYYEAKCNACHADRGCKLPAPQRSADPQRSDCIDCHMPRLGTVDVPHTVQTDHRLLRDPSRPPSATAASDESRIFDLEACPLAPVELDRARGIRLAQIAEATRDVTLADEAQELLLRARGAMPDDIDLLDALALTYVVQKKPGEAIEIWRSVLAIDPRRFNPLFTLTVLLQNGGKYREASVYLEKLLEMNPWLADLHVRQSQVLAKLGRTNEAAEAAERARELAPSQFENYVWLQSLRRLQGNEAEVRRLEELLEKLRPPKRQSMNERGASPPIR